MNTEIYKLNLRILFKYGKMRKRKNSTTLFTQWWICLEVFITQDLRLCHTSSNAKCFCGYFSILTNTKFYGITVFYGHFPNKVKYKTEKTI